ncbi:MAG: M23 family metallopeptidase [Leptospirales bacterium]|nr:M23 family metallopeptidase [Leptospirales bacterium]
MKKKYIIPLFIILFLADCSSQTVDDSAKGNSSGKKAATILKKPAEFQPDQPKKITFSNNDLKVTIYSKGFAQGDAIYTEIEKQENGFIPESLSFLYKESKVPVTKTPWGFKSLWCIHPDQKPGKISVSINYKKDGKNITLSSNILIKKGGFLVSKTKLDLGNFSNKSYTGDSKFKETIAECTELRKKAFGAVSENKIQNTISHPRDMHKITSEFWKKRVYLTYQTKGKKKVTGSRSSIHRGLDLKGDVGAPVYAMIDGEVVLAHSMFYEGNMVVIDHGNQIFSYYQHLDSISVKTGDIVKAGDTIGGVGATGMVTGPHLHVAFVIQGVHIDPLSVLSLPISK